MQSRIFSIQSRADFDFVLMSEETFNGCEWYHHHVFAPYVSRIMPVAAANNNRMGLIGEADNADYQPRASRMRHAL
jgi:hypothetical protein